MNKIGNVLLTLAVVNLTLVALIASVLVLEPTSANKLLSGFNYMPMDELFILADHPRFPFRNERVGPGPIDDIKLDELAFFINHIQDSINAIFATCFLIVLYAMCVLLIVVGLNGCTKFLAMAIGGPLFAVSIFMIINAHDPSYLNHLFRYMSDTTSMKMMSCMYIALTYSENYMFPSECMPACFSDGLEAGKSCLKVLNMQNESSEFMKAILFILSGTSVALFVVGLLSCFKDL